MFESRSRKAFTLAEVLITLLIIGIIASIVIPSLIGDTQQTEFKVALKKAAATMNQALAMSIAQDSTDLTSFTSSGTTAQANLMLLFSNKLNVISSSPTATPPTFTTADGMTYRFYSTGSACDTSNTTTANADSVNVAKCYVLVDVNGQKKPNAESNAGLFKDQYYLVIRDKSVIPARTRHYLYFFR
jgi:prepilin-type N-terminal cleavage/methylation domain-containing protein